MTWKEAVEAAVKREGRRHPDRIFTRQELLANEQHRIQSDCAGGGETPPQTISRCLQELADDGIITFVDDQGTYQLNH
jgi:DNA-binding IclR family transcriptional regulator